MNITNLTSLPNIKFSENTNNYIQLLINDIIESKNVYDTFIVNQQTFQLKSISNDDLNIIPDFNLYPSVIQNYMTTIKKLLITFQIPINKRIFHIYLITKQNQDIDLDNYIENIFRWLFIADKYSQRKCSNELHIYISLNEINKTFPTNKNSVLDISNCNSAFTTYCMPKTNLHIFRTEEWFKIFIHETFHCMGFDFSHLQQDSANRFLRQTFPISPKFNFYLHECYSEFFAEIIHFLFYCSTFEIPIMKTFLSEIHTLQEFSLLQTKNILTHYNINLDTLFDIKNDDYTEATPVFSYFILKAYLLFSIQDTLNWFVTHNGSIQFKDENLLPFCEFISDNYKTNKTTFHEYIKNNVKPSITTKPTSLRMTCIEYP
jgi:hypothetical protein|uniref:Uncharacterized protein n=1 Tax=viral metagenome TaxID=1070528 RepID=A0A6C0IM76_9ZZZZ